MTSNLTSSHTSMLSGVALNVMDNQKYIFIFIDISDVKKQNLKFKN